MEIYAHLATRLFIRIDIAQAAGKLLTGRIFMKNKCEYCDDNSYNCLVFYEQPTDEWYLDVQTEEWDSYDDDFIHQRVYIRYCPYCGRSLYETENPGTCIRCKHLTSEADTSNVVCNKTGEALTEESINSLHSCIEIR